MHVRPAQGLSVFDPDTNALLPAEGAEVPESEYWMRRLGDGDVVVVVPTAAPRGAKKS